MQPLTYILCRAAALVISGIGTGCGIQQPLMAVKTVFEGADVALATSALMFIQAIAGTVMLSAAQNIFQGQLISEISRIPKVDPRDIVDFGASDLHSAVKAKYPDKPDTIFDVYNNSLRKLFLSSVILMCLMAIGAASMEWRKGE